MLKMIDVLVVEVIAEVDKSVEITIFQIIKPQLQILKKKNDNNNNNKNNDGKQAQNQNICHCCRMSNH